MWRPTLRQVEAMLHKFHAVIRAMIATKKVTIAAVHGHCSAAGRNWRWCVTSSTPALLRCGDFRKSARVLSAGGVYRLAALVGQKRAAELILTGRQ